jgi:hypothetical protein
VAAQPTTDPDILELKEQLAELKTTIQAQQQQIQQPSSPLAPNPHSMVPLDPGMLQQIQQPFAPPALNPSTMSLPPELATTMMHQQQLQQISNLQAEIAELRNLHQPASAPSPARKKACSNALTSELHLSEASLAAREDDDAVMDHES